MDLLLSQIPPHASHDDVIFAVAKVMHNAPVHVPGRKINFAVKVLRQKDSEITSHKCRLTVADAGTAMRFLDFTERVGGVTLRSDIIHVKRWTGSQLDATLVRQLQMTKYSAPASSLRRNHLLETVFVLENAAFGRFVASDSFSVELSFDAESIAASVERRDFSFVVMDPIGVLKTTVRIHFASINECIRSGSSIFMLLETAPAFLRLKSTIPGNPVCAWTRRPSPSSANEPLVELTYVGTTLELDFTAPESAEEFSKIYHAFHLPRLRQRSISIVTQRIYAQDLDELAQWFKSLSLPVALELEIIVRRGLLLPRQLLALRTHIEDMWREAPDDQRRCTSVLQTFARLLKNEHLSNRKEQLELESVFEESCVTYHALEFPHLRAPLLQNPSMMQVYHAVATPSSLLMEGPYIDQSNAIIRRFPGFEHHFLRVCFWDEHGCRLRVQPDIDLADLILHRYGAIVQQGLDIGGRHFSFLGYSTSALREHATWFVTPFDDADGNAIDANVIIQQSGDYSNLDCPARYGARLSQNFTATVPSVTLMPFQVHRVSDVYSSSGSNMTDGCGSISPALLEEVSEWLPLKLKSFEAISALQIRLGGYKGVLVRKNGMLGKTIAVRESMRKFDAPGALKLHIARAFFRPQTLYLNRPLIQQLEGRGVPAIVFLRLQERNILTIHESTKSIEKAANFLATSELGTQFCMPGLLRGLNRYFNVGFTESEGRHTVQDPFIEECLSVAVTHVLRELKHHARIQVPGSWTLVGVADEHECLTEGEIYATIRTREGERIPLLGRIAVTRSPQEHPGDIQFATGVHREELAYLENVVVFSCQGDRSLPSCLGGGDLDGDEYNLIMNPALHPPLSYRAAKYAANSPKKLGRKCTIADVGNFVVEYLSSDLLGMIATRRLHIADQSPKGTSDPRCIHLAYLASLAVDYPKTGVAVRISGVSKADIPSLPDFMSPQFGIKGKLGQEFYCSENALGLLFRRIDLQRDGHVSHGSLHSGSGLTLCDVISNIDPTPWGLDALPIPSDHSITRMVAMFKVFRSQLTIIAHSHTMSRSQTFKVTNDQQEYLSEAEVVMGSILYATSDRKKRKSLSERLHWQTQELSARLKEEMFAGQACRNSKFLSAFTAFKASMLLEEGFGVQSFRLVAISCMIQIIQGE